MKELFRYKNQTYNQKDLIETLEKLGIKNGDIIYIHSEIYNFGIPLLPIKELLKALIECFFEVIGKDGTLVMPTFTYSFCNNEVYDKLNSKCTVGALNEFFRLQQGVKRTNDPIFSFAVKGNKEELFLKETTSCFGKNSVYDELTKNNAKAILFGGEHLGFTYFHYIEEKAKITYRYHKTFKGNIIDENGIQIDKEIQFFCRDLTRKYNIIDQEKVFNILDSQKLTNKLNFGGAQIVSFEIEKFYTFIFDKLTKNENYLLFPKEF
ncbi:aminoglycoside N(3)-acetyltransferase [Campylobacter sp. W0014]|uniref:AAC(3) family N-acetyltransferase n=1 Tax=Campylobacter sp. W0014 TaxID=2735781 RepID=UPI001EC977B0|nr:aminoglycoside N(3)-acetyltransferase [Campylobacter sp. W0014]